MLGYVTIGVNDMEKAKQFYGDLLAPLGASVVLDAGRIVFFGTDMGSPMLAVCTPYNEEAPAPGNGNMVAIGPGSKEKVDEMYNKAIALGASSEGEPGQRIEDMFYGAYFRDPDGNKVCFFQFG
ncbi:MAG: VOC family protein [Pseudomonadota bacterium]